MILRWVRKVLGFREPGRRETANDARLDVLAHDVAAVTGEARNALRERERIIAATRGATQALRRTTGR